LEISNVKIESRGVAHNDGIGIDGCRGVRISNCDVDSGDDALVFKTTHSAYPCSDIRVEGMRLRSNQAGIKMGTESMAPFEDITIVRCHIYDTRNGGIKLFSVDGARMRNITISDITMDKIRTPILLRLGERLSLFRKESDTRQSVGFMRDVTIRNVKARSDEKTQLTSATGVMITGIPGHPIERLTLENIEIELPGGGTVAEGRHEVPEAIDQYPEVKAFGPTIPARGVWMRHVDGVTMSGIVIKTAAPDLRPVFVAQDAQNVRVNSIAATAYAGSESVVRFTDCRNVYFVTKELEGESAAVVQVSGKDSGQIDMPGKHRVKSAVRVVAVDGADPRAVILLESEARYDWKPDSQNKPIGIAQGIFPGRVVWTHAPGAAHWSGEWKSMESPWWLDENTDQVKVDAMMDNIVTSLTGEQNHKKAWKSIFEHHNMKRHGAKKGYRRGEIVAIKVNMNSTNRPERTTNYTDIAPQTVYSLVAQLVEHAGVGQGDIVIYDAKRYMLADVMKKIWARYPDVRFLQEQDPTDGQLHPLYGDHRRLERPQWTKGVEYSNGIDYPRATRIPRQLMDATYLVNLAMLKAHSYPYSNMEGGDEGQTAITMTAKNNFGSIEGPSDLHAAINTRRDALPGAWTPMVDISASPNVGAKTILYLLDGLYCARKHSSYAVHFPNAPFFNKTYPYANPEWPSCLLGSLDGVALDSAGLDILHSQTKNNTDPENGGRPWLMLRENADDYLHEMADAANAPSGTVYMQGGTKVISLGTHEHWDDDATRRYSRNLDPAGGSGIELVYKLIE
jgi:uncharacterized protein (DUF362 family)